MGENKGLLEIMHEEEPSKVSPADRANKEGLSIPTPLNV